MKDEHEPYPIILVLPALITIFATFFGPIVLLVRMSLDRYVPGQFVVEDLTAENYTRLLTESDFFQSITSTLIISASTTVLCIVLGVPAAYVLARLKWPLLKAILLFLTIAPLLIGNVVRSAGWIILLGYQGLVHSFIELLGFSDADYSLLYTPAAVIIGLVSVLLPIVIIIVQSNIESIDVSLEEASQSLGRSPLATIVRVVIPLSKYSIITAGLFCFILSMNSYATPVLLGGPETNMMAPAVYNYIAKIGNWPAGAALAVALMVTTLFLAVLSVRALSRNRDTLGTAHG